MQRISFIDKRGKKTVLQPGVSLAALTAERQRAEDKDLKDKQVYQKDICQCCSLESKSERCICNGIRWFMDEQGDVECEAHRMKRLIDGSKRKFFFFGKR